MSEQDSSNSNSDPTVAPEEDEGDDGILGPIEHWEPAREGEESDPEDVGEHEDDEREGGDYDHDRGTSEEEHTPPTGDDEVSTEDVGVEERTLECYTYAGTMRHQDTKEITDYYYRSVCVCPGGNVLEEQGTIEYGGDEMLAEIQAICDVMGSVQREEFEGSTKIIFHINGKNLRRAVKADADDCDNGGLVGVDHIQRIVEEYGQDCALEQLGREMREYRDNPDRPVDAMIDITICHLGDWWSQYARGQAFK